MHLLLAIAEE